MIPTSPRADTGGRPLTRRRFLEDGLSLLVAGGVLGACGGGKRAQAPAPATTATAAGKPVRGGTLVFSASSEPSGFDAARWWNPLSWSGTVNVFDRLVRTTDKGTFEPELLSGLPEVNSDGTQYTLRLRPGVKFHHGRALTADDVKFSLERLVNPETASEGASLYTGLTIPGMDGVVNQKSKELEGIEVVDDGTLTIALEKPDSVFLYLLGLPFAGIVPRDVVEEVGDKKFNFAPVGTGPFLMKDVDPSKGLALERNPAYWDPELPYVDRVQWSAGIEPKLAVLRIESGEQDLMLESVPKGSYAQLRGDAGAAKQLVVELINDVKYFTLSLKHDALKSLDVRKAIAMAVDKERYVRAIDGLGQPATGGLFSPLSPYYQEDLAYAFDPAGAKELLTQAGYADGFDVTFWGINVTPFLEIGQTVQQDLGELGIRVDYKPMVLEAYVSEVVKNPAGITDNEWPLPYPHGSYVMDGAFTSAALDAGCCNFSEFVSAEFDGLAEEAHRTSDQAELVRLYRDMDRIAVADNALWVPMVYPKRADFVSKRLRGFWMPAGPSADTRFFSRYWIEEA